jgi:oxalate decarboxylase/phosphoglucose isomerase-like protein (cupin superfamily)
MSAIPISEGFNLGFCRALPGKGPMMHNHDTNETFICISGRWRASWEQPDGKVDWFDLDPLDVISFPPGCIRRFENISRGPKNRYSTLLFVIAGDGPHAEFTTQAMAELAAAGLLDGKPRRAGVHRTAAAAQRKQASPARKPRVARAPARAPATCEAGPAAPGTKRAR